MLFLNPLLLFGLAGVLVPVILHLIRKQSAKPYDWGAMRFLFDTVAARRKRMEWEDFLLMVARCLLIALIALAVSRPFVPPDSQIPWLFVLPLGLLGVAFLGGSFVLSSLKATWLMRLIALVLIGGAGFISWQEKNLNLSRFQTSPRRDVALVIDGSTSMLIQTNGQTAFARAVEEARQFVKEAPTGTAFSVVLGGPAPEMRTGNPLTHRADVLDVLNQLEPVGGPFRAHEALGVATLTLAEGRAATKDIVVFTDQQRLGWQLESTTAWGNLGDAWEGLPAKPRLLVRSFPPPEDLRNVSISAIELSREIVGTDREVMIRVRVENTGTEVITPGLLKVTVGNKELESKGVGQLIPGEEEVIDYRHRFSEAGPQVIKAVLESKDDLSGDDVSERVLWVKKTLPILIVEGNSGASFFDRAGGYLGLALAPAENDTSVFVDPRVVEAGAFASETLENDTVVVLADVARLPSGAAGKLVDFVLKGGGLWILAGPNAEEEFYQKWQGGDGPVVPLKLGEMTLPENGVRVAPGTFDHPVLRIFKDAAGSDLSEGVIVGYRKSSDLVAGAQAAARYADGEIFMATRSYGHGRVVVTTTGLDARMGSLPARPSFVPLVHELTNWLAGGKGVELNVKASWSPTLSLPTGGGLRATYLKGKNGEKGEMLNRVDSAIDFNWSGNPPEKGLQADEFIVKWEGSLLPPQSGEYYFEAIADDEFQLWVDGDEVLKVSGGKKMSQAVKLVAGQVVSIRAKFEEQWGEAHVSLSWKRPDGEMEVVPASAFLAVIEDEEDVVLATSRAVDPKGRERDLFATQGRRGRLLEVEGAALPGQYQLAVPAGLRSDVGGEEKLPLVVMREGGESRFERWNEDDRNLIRREIVFMELSSIENMLSVLRGEGFGREIWKVIAIAALVLFFLEGLLARWVSKSRKAGEEVRVDFEKRDEVPAEFLKSVAQTKGGAR
ncbi:PA14 domain-containing protein [Akkermansiaceae bacterium]|nr:PA14 domain-containing protein [Akkermansiaceae bacterium]